MKYFMKYLIVPFFKLIWASVFFTFILAVNTMGYIVHTIWTFKFQTPFIKSVDYRVSLFEYIVTENEYFDEYSDYYKTPFHWALNIEKTIITNKPKISSNNLIVEKETKLIENKDSFKEFIEKEKSV